MAGKRNRKIESRNYYAKNKEHIKIRQKIWRENNQEKHKERGKNYYQTHKKESSERIKKYTKKLKELIMNHYGWRCNCAGCPEKNPIFFTIDHVNNDGYKDKTKNGVRYGGASLYVKVIKEGFPNKYQILCWNCNCGKRSNNGICPHNNILNL